MAPHAWSVETLDDLKLAPFHLLATEGAVHDDRDHAWHMQTLAEICVADTGVLLATQWREVDIADEATVRNIAEWWGILTEAGGEGVVIKPADYVTRVERPRPTCREGAAPRIFAHDLRRRVHA